MTAKQAAVKKYVVKLTVEEPERLNVLIQKGKAPARQLLKARPVLRRARSQGRHHSGDGYFVSAIVGLAFSQGLGRHRSRVQTDPDTGTIERPGLVGPLRAEKSEIEVQLRKGAVQRDALSRPMAHGQGQRHLGSP